MKRKSKWTLSQKILLMQILAFVIVYAVGLYIVPTVVYQQVCDSEAAAAMHFNEQVAMRIGQCFNELERFSGVVASDDELNDLLWDYIESPDASDMARLRLYLSNLRQKDGVSSYRVLGMYLEIEMEGEYSFYTSTVGLSDSLKDYICQTILPSYEADGKEKMLIEPFGLTGSDSMTLFGDNFSKGYGYVQKYHKNDITGRLVIISSYDEIVYIVDDMKDYCGDFLLMTEKGKAVPPSMESSVIDHDRVLENMKYGDSYLEGYQITPEGIYTVRFISAGGWKLMAYLTRDEVLAKNRTQSLMILMCLATYGIVTIAALVVIVHKFISPLSEVSSRMGAIAQGDLKARVQVHSQDEIGEVSQSFNIMAERLEKMIEEIVEKEKLEQTMRYSLLISQVDPHFIYNTMNTITYLAQKGRCEDVIVVNKAMIEILRDRLRIETSEVFDTVGQELNMVKQYLTIQKYRYEETFKVKYDIGDKVENCLIMKNILQPLVENALAHGILENKDENGEVLGGCIRITMKQQGESLYVEVSDNGAGMSEERLQEVMGEDTRWERGSQIGIRNIRERIRYIYNTEECLKISSTQGLGTTISLLLPTDVKEGKKLQLTSTLSR